MRAESLQTMRVIVSLILRVVLLGIALPLLLKDFPNYKLPYRFPTDWTIMTVCDALMVFAPLMRTRKLAFLAGAAAMGAHYYYRHFVPLWDMAYLGVAIVFVLLPLSGRKTGKEKRRM
jgi:hypothetical protein